MTRAVHCWIGTILFAAGCLSACDRQRTAEPQALSVFNAAALGPPFRDLIAAFAAQNPGLVHDQLNAPSLEAVRMMTELGRVPDVLAVADRALLDSLVLPKYATWYVAFGTNALVLAYGPKARFRDEITTENWWQVLLRPGVETGRSDMRVDPSGYRADMAMQLAERHYGVPGLTAKLRAAIPERNVRRAEADLSAHLELGELDYGWTYESLARAHGLAYVKLPAAVDLSDPALASTYASAHVELPEPGGRAPIVLRGAPIVFAVTVPTQAPHGDVARRFVTFLLSAEGREILGRSGFSALATPDVVGTLPSDVIVRR
ncbi:MAG: extracellular solute-binding protein [Gemmatimonadaceae bacterium]|nr:extracellular solute-binding protein [Gemmatimonadaceae bacterium]